MSDSISTAAETAAVIIRPVRTAPKYQPIKEDWLSKTLAGGLLGLALALIASSLFANLGPGGLDAPDKSQFNMWIVPPLWMTVFSLVYMFRSGLRAWLWLGGFTLVGAAFLFAVRVWGGN